MTSCSRTSSRRPEAGSGRPYHRAMPAVPLPDRPPFAIRARIVSPLASGGTLHETDGLVAVDADGSLAFVGAASAAPPELLAGAVDVRPWVVLPGLVDTHAHLPQLPNAGLGFALDLLTWLDRLTFPTERSWADPAIAERLAPAIFRAFAAAGTTTVLAYGVVYEAAMEASFRAAEAHGIRAILGKVMMDRVTYDPTIEPGTILDRSLREAADLIGRWHGAADGRLGYAVTPRFAVSCTAEMLRESASLARSTGSWWQTHVSEDPGEIAEVQPGRPAARADRHRAARPVGRGRDRRPRALRGGGGAALPDRHDPARGPLDPGEARPLADARRPRGTAVRLAGMAEISVTLDDTGRAHISLAGDPGEVREPRRARPARGGRRAPRARARWCSSSTSTAGSSASRSRTRPRPCSRPRCSTPPSAL